MNETKDKSEEMLDRLRSERDHLKVRMHLAGAELRDEWERLEPKWRKLESGIAEARKEAKDLSHDVRDGISVVGEEIAEAYRRIRRRLG